MSNKTLVIIGAGGHAKVCYEIAVEMKQWDNIIILDDNPINDFFEISGKVEDIKKYPSADFFVAIGDNSTREKLLNILFNKDYSIATLIHSESIISPTVTIDKGTVVMGGVVINANTFIGIGCILNTSSSIDHDNIIQEYVHISPGVNIAGNVRIGAKSWIGIGSSISNSLLIESEVILGAGSLVLNDITKKGVHFGVPAQSYEKMCEVES